MDIISLSGNIGIYYVTNEKGNLYKWDVDNMVKFKRFEENKKISQRYVNSTRGSLFHVRSTIKPE